MPTDRVRGHKSTETAPHVASPKVIKPGFGVAFFAGEVEGADVAIAIATAIADGLPAAKGQARYALRNRCCSPLNRVGDDA